MFSLNDKVVYPGHGVATITKVFEKKIGTIKMVFYELKFISTDMTVMVPQERCEEIGVRVLSCQETISEVFSTLESPSDRIRNNETVVINWSKKQKEYQNKLHKGSLKEISEIYRDLKTIAKFKELSFGEKNLLAKTEHLLVEEISAAKKLDEQKIIEKLRSFFPLINNDFKQRTL